jgi:co-chaperonin GroES (HSP10)
MTMTLRPDTVLIKLAPPAQMSEGGIILEPALPPPTTYGKVVQAGAKVRDVEVGQIVGFPPSVGDPVDVGCLPHLFVRERDIAFVLERDV